MGRAYIAPRAPRGPRPRRGPRSHFREDALRAWLADHLADLLALAGAACCGRGLFLLAGWVGWLGLGLLFLVFARVVSQGEPRRSTP